MVMMVPQYQSIFWQIHPADNQETCHLKWGADCLAPLLGELEFLKNCNRYHKMVLGHHNIISKLHSAQIYRFYTHWYGFCNTSHNSRI